MKLKYCLIFGLAFILIIFIIGFKNAGTWLVKKDKILPADAMVILMGSVNDRVLMAEKLYFQGFADNIIIVNTRIENVSSVQPYNQKSNSELAREMLIDKGIPDENILLLPGGAQQHK